MSMDSISQSKISFWVIVALVILNACSLGILWYGHFQKPTRQHKGMRPDGKDFFINELNMNQQQAQTLMSLRAEHFKKTDSIKNLMHQLSLEMIEELFSDTSDTTELKRISDQIGKEQAQFELFIYNHFNDVKKLCEPKHHPKLKQLILDVVKTRLPPRGARDNIHPPPPHRPDDRPPPPHDNKRPPPPVQGG